MAMTYPDQESRSAALYHRASEVLAGGSTRHTATTATCSRPRASPGAWPRNRALLNRGFILGAGGLAAISTANTDQEIDDLADAIEDSLREMRLNDPES